MDTRHEWDNRKEDDCEYKMHGDCEPEGVLRYNTGYYVHIYIQLYNI